MELEILLLLTAIIAILYFLLMGIICYPLHKIRGYFINARSRLQKDFEGMTHHNIISVKESRLFDDNKIQNIWNKYFKIISSGDGNHKFTDIGNFFEPEKFIVKSVNVTLSSVIPILFFISSSVLTIIFGLIFGVKAQTGGETIILIFSVILLLSALMMTVFRICRYKAGTAIEEFNMTVSETFDTPYGTGEQISDLRIILGRYHSDQIKLYSKLNKEISLTVVQKLEPFLDAMEKMVRDYLSAISIDQKDAMEHLSDYFMRNTSELYDGQMEKITDATLKMTQIQEKTSGSLESITAFFNNSTIAIDKVLNNSKEMSDSYDKYLTQMKDMSFGIESNIKLMVQMLEYIDENAKNKDFTIEKLTSFQEELIKTSEDSAVKMKEFFDEFKDSYTSHILAVKSVSDSLQNSGITLESSYKDFNNSLGNISGFFEDLKNGINEVRDNTNEMSAIYKENLEQLHSVNKLVEENINSSSDLTEYINNSLKSNNFTIEKLAEFQKELIDISDRSGKAMNEFFTDFKDHYSSYIIAMKAASADMQKSGEIVKESYSGFATNLDKDVSGVFMKFEENLTEISIRFGRSIKDLQDAIDELPEIIKGIKKDN